jgi:predicted phosphodiesterase
VNSSQSAREPSEGERSPPGEVKVQTPLSQLRQVEIIHLSDLHFGDNHVFDPEKTPSGDMPSTSGMPDLAAKLSEDVLRQGELAPWSGDRGILCVTGDFADNGSYSEFRRARSFLEKMVKDLGLPNIHSVFIVPGNHDVKFNCDDMEERWHEYVGFYNGLFSADATIWKPYALGVVHDRSQDLGIVVACVNSSLYVRQGTKDELRGQIDEEQLNSLEDQLRAIDEQSMRSAIKIALIHHHPILIPSLTEASREYDAVVRAGPLLSLLNRFGFHLLLHGHKHNPHTFVEDVRNAFEAGRKSPMMVLAGGSVSSRSLPSASGCCNCYNRVTLKWHPQAGQARIRVVTRGLVTRESRTNESLLAARWYWKTEREHDQILIETDALMEPRAGAGRWIPYREAGRSAQEERRTAEYRSTRGNFPVVEVRPSLEPSQAYNAIAWIEPHRPDRDNWESPKEVIWSAGGYFDVASISRDDDDRFCVGFDYWGPVLLQAELLFDDGERVISHVYARLPSKVANSSA